MNEYDRTVNQWQIHNLDMNEGELIELEKLEAKPMVFTATVVDDPTGKWKPGYHMRSTLIKEWDKDTGIVKTMTKTYKLEGEGGDPVTGNDWGNRVLGIFY